MINDLRSHSRATATAAWMIIIAIVVFSLVYFRSLIQPFILALVVWYLIRGVRNLLSRIKIRNRRVPKWLAGILAILLTFGILWFVIQIISYNVNLIIGQSSQYESNLETLLQGVKDLTGIDNIDAFLSEQASGLDYDLQSIATGFLNSVSALLANAALVIVYVIFLLIEENFIPDKLKNLMMKSTGKATLAEIIPRISKSVNTYFTVKFVTSLLTGFLSYIVLLVIGVDFAVLWAFMIFLFNFIPYVGSLVATLLPSFFAIFQFASLLPFLWVFISVELVQILVGNYIEPRIMGKTLNLSPLVVLLSLAFWGSIWGVVGMILSVPIISVIVIILSHFSGTKNIAILLSEKGTISGGHGEEHKSDF
ncbi:MAG: AI-2 transport protein TqsA [Cyclobacteriaceae bacterium]|jgi:AI-2 transport protein TqsA